MAQQKPWERYGAAQSADGGQVFTLPPSPEEQARAAREEAAQRDREADNARADEALDLRRETAALDQALKRVELEKKQGQAGASGGDAKQQARLANLEALTQQINRVQELYEAGPGATSGVAALGDYLPTETNRQFDTASAGLAEQGLAAFRVPGVGAQSDTELRQFVQANRPQASDYDVSIEEKLRQLRSRVDATREGLGLPPAQWQTGDAATNPNPDRDENAVAAAMATPDASPPGLPPANEPGGNDPTVPLTPASGATRTIRDDRLSSQIDSMVNAGASEATINAVLTQQGLPPVPLGSVAAAKAWMKQNPGKRYYGANVTNQVPLNMLERAAGSPLGAGVAHYANAATAGTAGALAGDQGRGALDAMEAMNPGSAMTGNILGGITGAMGAELGIGARLAGTGLARFAPRIADAGYGGLFGFNEAEEGEGVTGALTGAIVAPIAGSLGERAMRGAGAAIKGVTNPAVQRLREAGVPLTVGQAVGGSGRAGEFIKNTEDALTSIPLVGGMVNARRMEGMEGFNRAAFQRAPAPGYGAGVTDTGAQGMQQITQAKNAAYRGALDPVDLDIAGDPAALQAIMNAQLGAAPIPQGVGQNAVEALDYRIGGGMSPEGRMDGRDFQEAYRGLGRDRRTAPDPYASEFGGAMREGQEALADALERQHPGQFPQFIEANAANRRAEVLAAALKNAANQGDELFTPAQLNRADVQSTSRLEGAIQSASGNRPFYDLATAGQSVLPSKLPDSGTANRMMTGMALTGAGLSGAGAGGLVGGQEGAATGGALGLGSIIALAIGGSRPAQQMLTGAMVNRPAIARAVGEAVQRNAKIGGGFGAGILTPLTVGAQ